MRDYTNFWRRAAPFVLIWRNTSLARLGDLELALRDNLGSHIVFSKSYIFYLYIYFYYLYFYYFYFFLNLDCF